MKEKTYTLEQYNKKYRNRRKKLLVISKKQLADFEKQNPNLPKGELLKKKKWTLIGDTYYQIPRFPSLTWFRNLNIFVQIGTCTVAAGLIAGAITVGVMYGTQPHIEYITYTLDPDIELKDLNSDVQIVKNDLPGVSIAHKNSPNKNFRVMAFTDLHLDHNKETCSYTISMMARNIIKNKPDLVVFCGDTITSSYNEPRTKQFADVLEKLGVYWCAVLGNHEKNKTNPHCIERDKMIGIVAQYPHCLIDYTEKKTANGSSVWGIGNSIVNLMSDEGVIQSLYFLDSGTEMTAEQVDEYCPEIIQYKKMGKSSETETEFYDFIKNNQVNWYQETFSQIRSKMKNKGTKVPHSTIFTHVPIVEQETAYVRLFKGLGGVHYTEPQTYGPNGNLRVFTDFPQQLPEPETEYAKEVPELYNHNEGFIKGVRNRRREDVCYSPHDLRYSKQGEGHTPILEAMQVFGNNNALFCGHDHSNNYTIKDGGQFLGYVNSGCYSSNNLYTKGLLGKNPYKPDDQTDSYSGHLTQGYTDIVYTQDKGEQHNIIEDVAVRENYEIWKEEKPELYTRALNLVKDQLFIGKGKIYKDSHGNYLDGKGS